MNTESRAHVILIVIIAMGFFGLLTVMSFHQIPEGNKDILEGMLGVLGTALSTIVMFYFGSSAASKSKDAAIEALSKSPTSPNQEQKA